MSSESQTTTDHDEIRKWVDQIGPDAPLPNRSGGSNGLLRNATAPPP